MDEKLSGAELIALVRRVFQPQPDEKALAVLVDLPDSRRPDTAEWQARRLMAQSWVAELEPSQSDLGFPVKLWLYRNCRANNADLPSQAWEWNGKDPLPQQVSDLAVEDAVPMLDVFNSHSMFLAPTQFSATAPMKLMARRHGFRAATMPGFSEAMIPALRLDYVEINRRVDLLKALLDRAVGADICLLVDSTEGYELHLDLRHRQAHASGGLLPKAGTAGNLPSGETYIVPYEGEFPSDPSRTRGDLPVQFGTEVVVYEIVGNRAISVTGSGTASEREAGRLLEEPAYGNMAELGLGVLADFGVQPCGSVLLDEKLGLHVAFGRSDHFGGQVGAKDFSTPEAVVHIDRVYLPAIQPRIKVASVTLTMDDNQLLELIRDDAYVIDFS